MRVEIVESLSNLGPNAFENWVLAFRESMNDHQTNLFVLIRVVILYQKLDVERCSNNLMDPIDVRVVLLRLKLLAKLQDHFVYELVYTRHQFFNRVNIVEKHNS